MKLTVRPLAARDFDGFINYWRGLSRQEIESMGIAIDRMPSATRVRSDLKRMLTARNRDVGTFVLAWCVNGEANRPFVAQTHRAGRFRQHSSAHVAYRFAR